MIRPGAVGLCVVGLLAVGCGEDGGAAPSPTTLPTTTTTEAVSTVAPTSAAPVVAPTSEPSTTEPVFSGGCTAADTEAKTFVDDSRPTPATAESEELPSRTLDVWIDRPLESGPWPLVIFAHGLTGHPRSHETHRTHLAEACFVVVAPAFPLTNNDFPGAFLNAGDTEGQVGDVSFLIDEVLAGEPAGAVDPQRVGVIGHSLGGLTAAGAVLAADGDSRVSAAVVMSAGFGHARDDLAVMVLHGDADTTVPIASSIGSYPLVEGRGVFVTLLGGDHIAGIIDGESDYGPIVRATTGAFFAHELKNEPTTIDELFELPLDLASIEARTAAGPLDDWRAYFGR